MNAFRAVRRLPLWAAMPALLATALLVGCLSGGGRSPIEPKRLEPRAVSLALCIGGGAGAAAGSEDPTGVEQYLTLLRRRLELAGMAHYTSELRAGARIVVHSSDSSQHDADRLRWLATAPGRLELRVEANPKQIAESTYPSRAPPGFAWLVQRTLYGQERTDGDRVLCAVAPALADGRVTSAVVWRREGECELMIRLDPTSAAALARASTEAAAAGRRLGILCDGNLLAAPRLTGPIADGRARLTAGWSPEEARDLAALWNGGALDFPVTVEEFKVVAPRASAPAPLTPHPSAPPTARAAA